MKGLISFRQVDCDPVVPVPSATLLTSRGRLTAQSA